MKNFRINYINFYVFMQEKIIAINNFHAVTLYGAASLKDKLFVHYPIF